MVPEPTYDEYAYQIGDENQMEQLDQVEQSEGTDSEGRLRTNQPIDGRIDNATDQNNPEEPELHVTPTDDTDVDASFSDGDLTLSLADDTQTTEGNRVDVSPGDVDPELSTGDDGTLTVALEEDAGTTMQRAADQRARISRAKMASTSIAQRRADQPLTR